MLLAVFLNVLLSLTKTATIPPSSPLQFSIVRIATSLSVMKSLSPKRSTAIMRNVSFAALRKVGAFFLALLAAVALVTAAAMPASAAYVSDAFVIPDILDFSTFNGLWDYYCNDTEYAVENLFGISGINGYFTFYLDEFIIGDAYTVVATSEDSGIYYGLPDPDAYNHVFIFSDGVFNFLSPSVDMILEYNGDAFSSADDAGGIFWSQVIKSYSFFGSVIPPDPPDPPDPPPSDVPAYVYCASTVSNTALFQLGVNLPVEGFDTFRITLVRDSNNVYWYDFSTYGDFYPVWNGSDSVYFNSDEYGPWNVLMFSEPYSTWYVVYYVTSSEEFAFFDEYLGVDDYSPDRSHFFHSPSITPTYGTLNISFYSFDGDYSYYRVRRSNLYDNSFIRYVVNGHVHTATLNGLSTIIQLPKSDFPIDSISSPVSYQVYYGDDVIFSGVFTAYKPNAVNASVDEYAELLTRVNKSAVIQYFFITIIPIIGVAALVSYVVRKV